MRKAYLKYGGIVLIVLASVILIDASIHFNFRNFSQGLCTFTLPLVTGVICIRKAHKLNSHPQ
jgi:hypothetical protein